MKIYELARGDRFTVPELPDVPTLTFTDDGQVCNIAGYVECLQECAGG